MVSSLEQIEDFTLFLLLHMARVDGSLHPNERDTLLEKMQDLFPDNSTLNEKLGEMEEFYSKLKYGAVEDIIEKGSSKFSSLDQGKKTEIYGALFDIINANGRVNSEEKQVLQALKRWLTS